MGGYESQADQIVNEVGISIANWSTAMAVESIKWLLASLGQSTEPDLAVIVPIYDRMLAISLLLTGGAVGAAPVWRAAPGCPRPRLGPRARGPGAAVFSHAPGSL